MTKLYGQLVNRNGRFFVSHSSMLFNEPVMFTRYYATDVRVTKELDQYVGRLVSLTGEHRWSIADSQRWIDTNGEVECEETQIPPPRTTLLTRWYEGRWEKLTKRSGWVGVE